MPKVKVTASIDANLVSWIDQQISKKRFATRTHAIEYCIKKMMESEK